MPDKARPHLLIPPFQDKLPAPLFFRFACMPHDGSYPLHSHPWGEFVYSFSGVLEVKTLGRHYLAPPQYGLWLPPNNEHIGLNRQEVRHGSFYVAAELAEGLPKAPCALTISPLMRALLDHLRQSPPGNPVTPEEFRLMQVFADQLRVAPCAGTYLPSSDDPLLGPILEHFERHPGDNRSLAQLAHDAQISERTLMRRCQRDLGMSLAEWRQRLRLVRAMPLLQSGTTVERIAADLGYSGASAFIAMFRRMMGATPDEFRKNVA